MVRDIAREDGLYFRLASIRADMPRLLVREPVRTGRVTPIDGMAPLSEADIGETSHLVGQMGTKAFYRALLAEADVVIASRACDTAVFAAVPALLGCTGPPCTWPRSSNAPRSAGFQAAASPSRKACCSSGPRAMKRSTTGAPGSPARSGSPPPAHGQAGRLSPGRRARGPAVRLLRPAVIARIRNILAEVTEVVRGLACRDDSEDYRLIFRVYGIDGVYPWPAPPNPMPREIFILGECVTPSAERAGAVVRTTKQYVLQHGFPGRLSTAGNVAFPFAPPELSGFLKTGRARAHNILLEPAGSRSRISFL
jgi:hypothetical protein